MVKAIIQNRYGDPAEVFRVEEIGVPEIGPGEVLVQIRATPISGDAWHLTRGLPYVARPILGIRRPRNRVPGLDFAGTVVKAGSEVTTVDEGDDVFGWCDGALAEFAAVPEAQLTHKPSNLSLEEAALVPIAAFTAIQGVRDKGRVGRGKKVLITGASGGVGNYVIQLAKHYGAEVTAVSSVAKFDLVRSLGADHVIDYKTQPLTSIELQYDVLIDLYGNPAFSEIASVMKPGGTVVLIGGSGGRWFMGVDRWLRAPFVALFRGFRARPLVHKDRHDDLMTLKGLIEAGEVRPVLDRTFALDETAKAIEYVTDGHAHGQVVVTP
jgi:NADPH:quinone reductase-like Zn-dependent oxidoreductase